MPLKPQTQWNIKANNAITTKTADEHQINSIYHFCQHFAEFEYEFIMLSYRIAPTSALSPLELISQPNALNALIEQIYHEKYLFIDTITDFTTSYKGFITYIVLGFSNKGYLIDALALHQEVKQLKTIIENQNITKYCYRLTVILEDVKRDWSAFGCNFFDFQLIEKNIGIKKNPNLIISRSSQRPITGNLLQQLQQRYDNMVKYLAQIRYFLQQQQTQHYSIYSYSNHYQLLLKQYNHKPSSLPQEQKQFYLLQCQHKRRLQEEKENNFILNQKEKQEDEQEYHISNDRDKFLGELILQWRQHIAKMQDITPRRILNYQQIINIATQRPNSLLSMQKTIGNNIDQLELASQLLELITLETQLHENSQNELQPRINKRKEDKNIKSLLNDLKWEGKQEWLNRKNDQSIKLYKEIVSIFELDGSVIQEFTDGMNQGAVTNREIGRFVKYAEYFRNGNHKKLKEVYENNPPLESGQTADELEGWESEEENSFITGKTISKSQTSIASSSQKITDKSDLRTLPTIRSPNSFSSLLEFDPQLKVDPLPQNIQQIYLKAASVKKGYQKVQKKKAGRKQGKEEPQQFVPSWQQIKLLLQS